MMQLVDVKRHQFHPCCDDPETANDAAKWVENNADALDFDDDRDMGMVKNNMCVSERDARNFYNGIL